MAEIVESHPAKAETLVYDAEIPGHLIQAKRWRAVGSVRTDEHVPQDVDGDLRRPTLGGSAVTVQFLDRAYATSTVGPGPQ